MKMEKVPASLGCVDIKCMVAAKHFVGCLGFSEGPGDSRQYFYLFPLAGDKFSSTYASFPRCDNLNLKHLSQAAFLLQLKVSM